MRKKFLWLSLLVLVLDQLSKTLVSSFMKIGESISVLGIFFRLTYVFNPGGAFGTKLGNNIFYAILSVLAIIIAYYFFLKSKKEGKFLHIAFSLVLGGAAGNLLDRIRYGEVADFLDFDFFNIKIPPFKFGFINYSGFFLDRWPVFNIADSAVTIGMILILWYVIIPRKSSISTP
ncbi:MAG: signal peptidase II [candidate division Zixibacteria bacterium]|nr:signal peptidase II [candidate division Zixibacteria bacterium]